VCTVINSTPSLYLLATGTMANNDKVEFLLLLLIQLIHKIYIKRCPFDFDFQQYCMLTFCIADEHSRKARSPLGKHINQTSYEFNKVEN